ncbi:NAD-dependent epimerase/dehydratase family protein [Bacillus sp. 1P02SD]|uniref:NAD-dependent epimerase/dehydratase family protein n=1 Tax=Bacillus sp. 1P02SD TaxID=3132264 RepID=UPI0039A26DC5
MKKILITGQNSYVGKNLANWLGRFPNKYFVESISLRDNNWMKVNFSDYDVVVHLAAIVHKKEKPEMENTYFKVNRDLPIEVATIAKKAGVKQFIFMSTMAVYGQEGLIGRNVIITKETKPKPKTYYGRSKLEAEYELEKLSQVNFKVLIYRPPMIYGPNSPGNYRKLEKLALKTPIFPMINNNRSMLHIDKLCLFINEAIDTIADGLRLPQDDKYFNTSMLVKNIAEQNGRKIVLLKSLGLIIKILGNKLSLTRKIFGNLVYEIEK